MSGRRILLGIVVAALIAAIAWAFAVRGDEAAPPPTSGATGLAAVLRLPAGPPAEVVRRRQHATEEQTVVRCMAASGFRYQPTPYVSQSQGESEVRLPSDRRSAGRDGYGISTALEPAPAETAARPDPNDRQLAAMSGAERTAWQERLGDPTRTGSCRARGEQAATARLRPVMHDLKVLTIAYGRAAEASAALRSLDLKWSRCMGRSGYQVRSRDDAFELVSAKLTDARQPAAADGTPRYDPSLLAHTQQFERQLTIADLECSTPLAKGYSSAVERISTQLSAEHADEMSRVRSRLGGR